MHNVDYDPSKFNKDEYGNLYPKDVRKRNQRGRKVAVTTDKKSGRLNPETRK